jgi:hypothetical protein
MSRLAFVVALVGILGMGPVHTAAAGGNRTGADLAVGLDAVGAVILSGAIYEVSVTNLGPAALTSATVVVQLDPRATGTLSQTPACPMNTATDTLTCSFGPLAPGASASLSTWVVFVLPPAYTVLDATAARTASSPADPVPANDSAAVRCWNRLDVGSFPQVTYHVVC